MAYTPVEEKMYQSKTEDQKLVAAGWKEVAIGLWRKDGSCFLLDTNAEVGTIYHHSYTGLDGFLAFFYSAHEALDWVKENEEKHQKRYGK